METLTLEDGTKVVKLEDHNATLANVRKNATKGYIHTGDEDYQKNMAELAQFRSDKEQATLKSNYLGEAGFRIKPEYQDDVIKLTGINGSMDAKDVKQTLTDFTSAPKNAHYLDMEDKDTSGQSHLPKEPHKPAAAGGGGFWSKAFGK